MNERADEGTVARRAGRWGLGVGIVVGLLALAAGVGLYGARKRAEAAFHALERRLRREGLHGLFAEDQLAGLPDAAARFFRYTITPGAPLARVGRLEVEGRLRRAIGGAWAPFRASETIAPSIGFAWLAHVGGGPLATVGHDTLADGRAARAWWRFGLAPTCTKGGPDLARASAGRLALASLWVPASLLPSAGATWEEIDEDTAEVTLPYGDASPRLRITVDPDGRLVRAHALCWRLDDGEPRQEPYGFDRVLAEGTFGGYRVPTHVVVGWMPASSRVFRCYEPRIVRATYG